MAEVQVTKESTLEKKSIVVNQIVLRSIDRSSKDIQSYKTALQSAEYVIRPNRVALYDLYATVELDGHLTGIWKKRVASVRNKKLHFNANGKKIDAFDTLIGSKLFRTLQRKIMETQSHGLTGIEFIPGADFYWKEIPRKHIKTHIKKISFEQNLEEGVSYEGVWNLWIMRGEDDLGFLLNCAPYAIWKKGDMGDWAQYVEIFGQPVVIMKYDANDEKTKIELQQVIDNAGSSLRLLIPQQASFEMMDGKQSNGNGELQEKLKNSCNDEMSVIVLGNTETTSNSNGGSNAKAQEHGRQQDEIMKDDLMLMLNWLNDPQFLAILKSYGFPTEGGAFEYEKEFDAVALKADKEIDAWLTGVVPLSDDYYYEKYGRPKPDNYEELRRKMDEEKAAKLNPPVPPAPSQPKPGKPKAKKPGGKNKLSLSDRFKQYVSDFFDQAPKD